MTLYTEDEDDGETYRRRKAAPPKKPDASSRQAGAMKPPHGWAPENLKRWKELNGRHARNYDRRER